MVDSFWESPKILRIFGVPQNCPPFGNFDFRPKTFGFQPISATSSPRPRSNLGVLEPGVAGLEGLQ